MAKRAKKDRASRIRDIALIILAVLLVFNYVWDLAQVVSMRYMFEVETKLYLNISERLNYLIEIVNNNARVSAEALGMEWRYYPTPTPTPSNDNS